MTFKNNVAPGSFAAFHEQNPELSMAQAVERFTADMIQARTVEAVGHLTVLHVPNQLDIQALQQRGAA